MKRQIYQRGLLEIPYSILILYRFNIGNFLYPEHFPKIFQVWKIPEVNLKKHAPASGSSSTLLVDGRGSSWMAWDWLSALSLRGMVSPGEDTEVELGGLVTFQNHHSRTNK